jgi:hypothetical protein
MHPTAGFRLNLPCAAGCFGITPAVSDIFNRAIRKRFEDALRRFDEANARDPNRETVDGVSHPRELLYAQRLT